MKVTITGVAGFIGMHVAQRLLAQGVEVVGIDNLNDYYDVRLKEDRLKQLMPLSGLHFEGDMARTRSYGRTVCHGETSSRH